MSGHQSMNQISRESESCSKTMALNTHVAVPKNGWRRIQLKSCPKSNSNIVRAVQMRKPTNILELRLFCMQECAKCPPSWCTGLKRSLTKGRGLKAEAHIEHEQKFIYVPFVLDSAIKGCIDFHLQSFLSSCHSHLIACIMGFPKLYNDQLNIQIPIHGPFCTTRGTPLGLSNGGT